MCGDYFRSALKAESTSWPPDGLWPEWRLLPVSRPDRPETVHQGGQGIRFQADRFMRDAPHRFERSRVL